MAVTKIETGKFLARCHTCGRWQEVSAKIRRTEAYFEVWEADFRCCDQEQSAVFIVEKDYVDFH